MTDHQIKAKAIDKTYEHSIPTNEDEQKGQKVFAFIN
ncbi:hypothetical protein SA58113_1302 [Staphylococcus argenteus]|nr:hypothetical protein SA58113_1302 [Staphylococcus argenteus]